MLAFMPSKQWLLLAITVAHKDMLLPLFRGPEGAGGATNPSHQGREQYRE